MKKTILPILTLLATFACGSVRADGTEGDIWQIFPCDRNGADVDRSKVTSSDTVPAGSNIYFKVRLVTRSSDWTKFHIAGTGLTSTNTTVNPPKICLYVSGEQTFAEYVGEIEYGSHFTDVIFQYTPKAGDYAMPVKLGTVSGPASDTDKAIAYYFDPLTSWMWQWEAKKTGGSETAIANWFFYSGDPLSRDVADSRTTGMDYSLALCKYYIKTVDFDDEWESDDVWRSVHQGSETIKVGGTPSLQATAAISEMKTYYVWSEDETAVKVTGPNVTYRQVHTDGRWRYVAKVTMYGGQDSADFEIYGVDEKGGEQKDGKTKLVMSAYPYYNISDASGETEEDYVTVPVACAEVLPPTIRIVPEKTKVIASSNYTYYVTELSVRFTQAYANDVMFTVTPELEAGATIDWKDYLAIYDEKTLDISVSEATNTTYTIPAGSLVPMENGVQKRIYLFALRGDSNTMNTKHIGFRARTDNASAATDISGWNQLTGLMNISPTEPVILEPVEGDSSKITTASADCTLRIKVADTYADQNVVSNGYQIFIIKNTSTETQYQAVGGESARYVPGQGGYLYLTNAAGKASDILPTVKYTVTDPSVNSSVIYVKSPISGQQSAERHFNVTVNAPASCYARVIDDDGNEVSNPKFNEGDNGMLKIVLDRANDTGSSLYAFLKPKNDDAYNAIQCSFLATNDCVGLEIQSYGKVASDSFLMRDGRGAINSTFVYTVELRTAAVYQDGTVVTSYQCGSPLQITSKNVIPTVNSVSLGLDDAQLVDGKWVFPDIVVAKGVQQTFKADIDEPGDADRPTFKTRWRFSASGVSTKVPDNATDKTDGYIVGDPATNSALFTFTKAGTWTVKVDCKDKDMSNWGDGTEKEYFTFFVEVVDQPSVTVTAHYLSGTTLTEEVTGFSEREATESDGNACINVGLSFNKCDFPLVTRLTITDPGDYNPGKFELQTSSNVEFQGYTGGKRTYKVTFPAGETSIIIPVKSLDGTKLSSSTGFGIKAEMLTDDQECPESGGKKPKDYYVSSEKFIRVSNALPEVTEADIYPTVLSTNYTTVGTENVIQWDFTDVKGDFDNSVSGVKVIIAGAISHTEVVTDQSKTAGSYSFKLSDSGLNVVTIAFQDKDGIPKKFTIYYMVEASKTLNIVAHGPTSGRSGMYENNYGAGRIYAAGDSVTKSFIGTFNCGVATEWIVYGYGYKVGDIEGKSFHYPFVTSEGERFGYNDSRNNAINASGNSDSSGGYVYPSTDLYVDANGNPADSFLYAWLKKSTEESGDGKYSVLAYKPEAPLSTDAGVEVALPTEQLDNGSYVATSVEAVFSLEYLWTDNMGDINMDGIPDAWFHKFFASSDTTSSDSESSSIDDTTSVATNNDDEDFLPDLTLSGQGYLLDYTSNRKFSAYLELRGYGDSLNDAPNNNTYTRLSGFKPDLCYRDPDVYGPTSTLTKVEFLAWQEYAKSKGLGVDDPGNWAKWTPENPTDPTLLDTDDDGFDDGFEYAFWYRAHVGFYNESTKVHTYLTGRSFDPKNPGKGKFISSSKIEELMNPTVKASASATTRDSDNDGLPDTLEFTLGTNPFDFDTDGDGLTDGYEVLVTATDPLKTTTDGTSDASRNLDGDHMAFTTVYRVGATMAMNNDCDEYLLAGSEGRPVDSIQYYTTFAIESTSGDTDGVQWYAIPETTNTITAVGETAAGKAKVFSYYKGSGTWDDADNWVDAVTTRGSLPVVDQDKINDEDGLKRLALDLSKTEAYLYETNETGAIIIGEGVRVPRGAVLRYDDTKDAVDYYTRTLSVDIDEKQANAAWFYGNETAKVPGVDGAQQLLALGRHLGAKKGARIVAMPSTSRPVALMHHYVYQQFGFDPRTGWNTTSPLASHWSPTWSSYPFCKSARTCKFTALNEELVLSYLINTGSLSADKASSDSEAWATIWADYTTNPRGVGEGTVTSTETTTDEMGRERTTTTEMTVDVNGADTDNDGVPDGWELYVMGGTKKDGLFTTVDIEKNALSPLVANADDKAKSDTALDKDSLTELQEFAGTDSCAAYTNVSTTIVRPSEHEKWINKYFPTDPWNADTDGDGLSDSGEIKTSIPFSAGNFIYGTPAVDPSLVSAPGGGLNPCSVDTDLDGLPDAWEAQYAGSTVYSGEFLEKTRTGSDNSGNTSWGLIDGMDGTVADAYTTPNHKATDESTYEAADGLSNTVARLVSPNRDYDHDGLENWQEYMVGAMRCWRYDDPYTRWDAISGNCYTNADGQIDVATACKAFGFADANEFWYRTLVDRTSPYYNPHFVFDTVPAAVYWSRVDNAWDAAYDVNLRGTDSYYQFFHRSGDVHLKDLWGAGMELDSKYNQFPQKYVSCSPINSDTDQDGMDDYYELFHGMNPLLGQSGVRKVDNGAFDVVYDAWYSADIHESPFSAEENWWTTGGNQTIKPAEGKMDFVAYPFLAGSATADPDGDDVRNQEEAIMPELATATWHHTDPTPLWMTDTSFSNSLVRLFGRLHTQGTAFDAPEGSFTFQPDPEKDPETHYFYDMDGYLCVDTMFGPVRQFRSYLPDRWYVADYNKSNWLFSFEENEGYDTDHDGLSDKEELEGKFRTASDPINVDSPRRRQAMYFQGENRKSLLMTPPVVREKSPDMQYEYPDEMAFLQYTVECWAYPETDKDATLVERALWVTDSNLGDEEFLRCNFQLAIKNGKWYTKFDPRGTLSGNQVEVFSFNGVSVGQWTHIAATYDGKTLILYVNGQPETPIVSGLQPEYGAAVVSLKAGGSYAFDREYPLSAILVGASAKTQADGNLADGSHLNVYENQDGLERYKDWFKGYIDEIRIWDGARSGDEIRNAMKTRYTSDLAIENRNALYDEWSTVNSTYPHGRRRYAKDSSGNDCVVTAELRYHYAFDSVFAAENESQVAKVPHGFGDNGNKAPLSRPSGYEITWWSSVLSRYADTIYNDPAWITWIPNTIAHLPRFDGTTLDSCYWSEDFSGDVSGSYKFQRTAEPVSQWTQRQSERVYLDEATVNGLTYLSADLAYRTAGSRHHLVNSVEGTAKFHELFNFAGRHMNQCGDDLLPLGGAYVKYCDEDVGLWDEQGASSTWEITGNDADNDGLPDWWETYADEKYRIGDDPFVSIGWDTLINYNGNEMKAGDAYLRDLARGFYADDKGEVVVGPTKFRQTYDENANGIPDWWEDVYRLSEQNGLADSDNDGLPNYLEYMLSEIFDLNGKMFSPISAYSADRYVPDYFFRLGSLYVGEVFTDHDLVDDLWEDQYTAAFASRLKYDAFQDQDEDGWCNRSENRYSNQCMPLVANNQSHYSVADGLVADYPIPTVALTLRYHGARQDTVRVAPVVVEMTTSGNEIRNPDAVYNIGQITTEETGSNKDTEATEDTSSYTKTIGKWSNRRAIGTLTPGNIDQSTLLLQYCADPSAMIYTWEIPTELIYGTAAEGGYEVFSGTAVEYADAQRKYGKENVNILTRETAYSTLENLVSQLSETGDVLTWTCKDNSKTIGTVNLSTGAYDLNLGAFEGVSIVGTNAETTVSLESQTFRFAYSANPSVGLPRKLYLGDATTGYVREGKNTIVAYADLDSSGTWNPGEPYGIVRDVDVSWRGTSAEIELTDISPVMPRIDLVNDTDDRDYGETSTDDGANWRTIADVCAEHSISNNFAVTPVIASQSTPVRVRVVRWLVNKLPVYKGWSSMRTIYDKMVETDVKTTLTEADILGDDIFDLDWQYLKKEIIDCKYAATSVPITNMTYLVVIGDGPAEMTSQSQPTLKVLNSVITRYFDASRVLPQPISPAGVDQVVIDASPTFTWKIDTTDLNAYTAFKVQVMNKAGELVYDSNIQPMPSRLRDNQGNCYYQWQSSLFVGDKTIQGKVFENGAEYTWRVAAYNAKFSGDAFSAASSFRMNVSTNGYSTGSADVAVKYYGPKDVWEKAPVRVRAFTSPDFTGRPVAGGYVASPDDDETGLCTTGIAITANSKLIGLPVGKYYLQAFVDSNTNGTCDAWESQGYYCMRDGTTADYLNPVAITFDTTVGKGDLATIYLEDSDTDMDGLPDAWEYALYGNLTTKGVELLTTTPAGEAVVNTNLTGMLTANGDVAGGLAAKALSTISNAGTLALALGAPIAAETSFNDAISGLVSDELAEDGVQIEQLEIVNGEIVIKVTAESTSSAAADVALNSVLSTAGRTFEAVCDVERTESLTNPDWKLVKSQTITVGGDETQPITLDADEKTGGFYRVTVRK